MSRIAPTAVRRFLDAVRHAVAPVAGATGAPTATAEGEETDALVPDGGHGDDADDEHLREVPDGAGCTEIWEHLSERQAAEAEGDD